MRDICDKANPFRNEYREWDLWGYLNSVYQLEQSGAVNIWLNTAGRETLYMDVNPEGWVVPQLQAYRQQLERLKYGTRPDDPESACTNSFVARGEPGLRMMMELNEAKLLIKAEYIPKVPQWLTNGPPESAMLLPGGEVVSYGQVGNQDIMWQDRRSDLLRHYRYDAQGNILGQTEYGQPWWNLYFDLDGMLENYGEDSFIDAGRPGYIGIHHDFNADGYPTRYEQFTYRGEAPNGENQAELADQTQFMELYASEIPQLYELQQAAGGSGT